LGIRVGASGDGVGKVTMDIRDEHRQVAGVVQGGLIVTLADYAMYQAVKSTLEPGQHSVTVEIKVNFTAPAKDGELTATGRVINGGRRIIVAEAAVTDGRQTLIAHGLGTSLVVQRRP
jgi:uncharacterized protein (TIGR00369 family)